MTGKSKPRAAIYARISDDSTHEGLGVQRQVEDCQALAEREGLEVVSVHEDNDTGASNLSRKPRPGYEALLSQAEAGEISHVLAYSTSRLTRRPREFEAWVDLYETKGVKVLTVASGADDLSTANGRLMARMKASVDAHEAEQTGERVKRAKLGNALAGKSKRTQYRPFGWNDDGTLREPEATLLAKAAQDIISGASRYSVAQRWNAQGVTTTGGNPWSSAQITQAMSKPRLAGLQVHQGQLLTDAQGRPVRLTDGTEAILDETTWHKLQEALKPAHGRPVRHHVYLLTGLIHCGVCGGPMFGNPGRGKHRYMCNTHPDHNNTISGPLVDDAIGEFLCRYLAQKMGKVKVEAKPWPKEHELEAVTGRITQTAEAFKDGILDGAIAIPLLSGLRDQQKTLTAERDAWDAEHSSSAARELPTPTFEDWRVMPVETRGRVARVVLSSIVIKPSTGRRLDASRIVPDYVR